MSDGKLVVGNVAYGPPPTLAERLSDEAMRTARDLIAVRNRNATLRAAIERALRTLEGCHQEYVNGTGGVECVWCETQWPCAHAAVADGLRTAIGKEAGG